MPIVAPNDDAPPKPKPSVAQIAKPEYKGVTVDTKMEPVAQLLTHVEGSSWTVNYYSQVLDLDSSTQGQGMGTSPVHQQYRLIREMELKVTSPLTTSQNSETNNLSVTGAATVYPFVIPNVGDMFLADVGSGREGLFEITDVSRMSVFKQAVHTIEYRMVDYSTDERRADLGKKVVQTFQYDKDFIRHGQNPLIFEEEYTFVEYLRRNYRSIADRYFNTFFSKELGTLILPGQSTSTYDHYLTKAVTSFFSSWDSRAISNIRVLNTDDDYALQATSIWNVLATRDRMLMQDAFLKVGKVYAVEFTKDPMLEGVHWSGVDQLIYPTDPTLTVDYKQTKPPKMVNGSVIDRAPVRLSVSSLIASPPPPVQSEVTDAIDGYDLTAPDGTPVAPVVSPLTITLPPIIHPAMKDDYYVFSKAFYENNRVITEQSQLELMVHDYIDGKALSYKRLQGFCEDMKNWSTLERFYYTPVVLILIKAAIRSI